MQNKTTKQVESPAPLIITDVIICLTERKHNENFDGTFKKEVKINKDSIKVSNIKIKISGLNWILSVILSDILKLNTGNTALNCFILLTRHFKNLLNYYMEHMSCNSIWPQKIMIKS